MMPDRTRLRLLNTLLLPILLLVALPVAAHPHVWIDLRITPVLTAEGHLAALQQSWRFDPFYSLILIEELERGGPPNELEQRFDQLAREVVNNLARVDFFTHIQHGQQTIKSGPVTDYTLLQTGQRIEFSFELPLQQPILLRDTQLSYRIYDPGYYIEILHASEQGINTTGLPPGCQAHLEAPDPSGELIEQALSLDVTDTAGDPQLGLYFSERLLLDCR